MARRSLSLPAIDITDEQCSAGYNKLREQLASIIMYIYTYVYMYGVDEYGGRGSRERFGNCSRFPSPLLVIPNLAGNNAYMYLQGNQEENNENHDKPGTG